MTTRHRISFDRAADIYDETRGHPAEISAAIAESLIGEVGVDRNILEIGIGTGRIARPLLARGMQISGVDLSARMMQRLVQALPQDQSSPGLALADAVHLPFAEGTFQVVLSVHVFHLLSDLETALTEARRVLQSSGSFFVGYDDRPDDSPHSQTNRQWNLLTAARGYNTEHARPHVSGQVRKILQNDGASVISWTAAQWRSDYIPEKHIANLGAGYYSSTWKIKPDDCAACAAELRQWALEHYGSLQTPIPVERSFIWEKFEWG